LRFAPAFCHGFGKIGEQDREPEPERDLEVEAERSLMPENIANQQNARGQAANFDHEHHGILHHVPRVQLHQGIPKRAAHDLHVPDGFRFLLIRHISSESLAN
jgi:hypothetical protein